MRLEWNESGEISLEEATDLATDWRLIPQQPIVTDGVARIVVSSREHTQFFRLRQAVLTRVIERSPFAGETGVAVTREVIVRFSAPLAADALIGTDRFFAEADGRRLLARVELGADRQAATLFFLEPVPSNARMQVTLIGSGLRDASGAELDAEGDGVPGGTLKFSFNTAPILSSANTAVSGHVFASERNPDGGNRPLAGVVISVDGAEETLRTTTDDSGFFQLDSCPAGRFFVHIDGRTAAGSEWPSGAYYPFVGKAWETVAGTTNTSPGGTGEIFLPLIPRGALREVSPRVPTPITFTPEVITANPALAGVQIVVPPNALFADSGARGGMVGIAPVPPDRLPEPLPPGLEMPLVITIQTDGPQNFAEPVPVRFPNLPDPSTGMKLPPGAKSGLWSFNHDTGRWELQGPMTVSADGNFLDTDPGVGVRQPGWHGNNPGSDTDDDAPDDPPDDYPDPTAPDPWKKCKSEIGNMINSAFDCAYGAIIPDKLVPDENAKSDACAVGVGLAIPGTLRDCLNDPSGCKATIINSAGGALIGCSELIGKALGQELEAIGPVAKVVGFIHGCVLGTGLNFCAMADCLEQSSNDSFCVPDEWEAGMLKWLNKLDVIGNVFGTGSGPSPQGVRPQNEPALGEAPPEFIAEARTNAFFAQIRFTYAMRQLFVAFYGTDKWFPDSPADARLGAAFLSLLNLANDPNGDGGVAVTPAERSELLALAQPAGVTPADAEALISRMERMFNGTLSDQEWNLRLLLGSAVKYAEMCGVYQALGWTSQTEAFKNGLLQISQRFEDRCRRVGGVSGTTGSGNGGGVDGGGDGGGANGGVAPQPPRPLSYLLQNLDTGFQIRGQTQTRASLKSLVFAPNTYYGLFFVDDLTGTTTVSFFKSAGPGQTTKIPCSMWLNGGLPLPDTDGDGLTDLAERAAGTSPILADTDGDGTSDRLELAEGTSPLDGIALPNGLVGAAEIPNSSTLTVAAEDDVLYAGGTGVALTTFDLTQPRQPVRLGTLALTGQNLSQALAVRNGRVALGGPNGLALVDARVPATPGLVAQLPLGNVVAVAWLDHDVVALAGSTLHVVEGATGQQRLVLPLPEAGNDVQVVGDFVYVLMTKQLIIYRRADFLLLDQGRIGVTGGAAPLETGRKLFVGGGRAYVGTFIGFSVVDVTNPANPTLLGSPPSTQAAIHDLAANDAGLLVPAVSFSGQSTLAVGAYDISNPTDVTRFLTSWQTPGFCRSLTLHRGLAYVADTASGVQVLNYLAPDLAGVAPTLNFTANFPLAPARAAFDTPLRLLVDARDDVQVREVTAFVDGAPISTDGSFPFQLDFTAPAKNSGRTSFTLRLRATDTAGNTRWTDPLVVALADDITPPRLVATFPVAGARADNFGLTNVLVEFDQPLAPESITADMLSVVGAGPDKQFGTGDDVTRFGEVSQASDPARLEWTGTNSFPTGLYRVTLAAGLRGTNNTFRTEPVFWTFEAVSIRPRLVAVTPSGSSAVPIDGQDQIEARIDLATTAARAATAVFTLSETGPDRIRGNADDVTVPLAAVEFLASGLGFRLTPQTPLPAGRYRVALTGAAFGFSLVDFELRPVPNEWINLAGGRWDNGANWSFSAPVVNDFLRIRQLAAGLATTNTILPGVALARIECAADFVQALGNNFLGRLELKGEGWFDGLSRFLQPAGGNIELAGGGTIINRGTMQFHSEGNAANRVIELQNITLANRGLLEWEAGQLIFADPATLIFNEPGGIFDVGALATRTGDECCTVTGRIINAGLMRKIAGTNTAVLRSVTLENSGKILVSAGRLDLGDVEGPGEIEIQPGASIAFKRFVRLPVDARIVGGGDLSILGGTTNNPQVLVHRHELTGIAIAESNYTDVRRALNHPGIQFQSRHGWFRFFAPLSAHRLWTYRGSFQGIELNASTTTEILQLEHGILAGPAAVAVTQNLLWSDGTIDAGGEITLQGTGEIGNGFSGGQLNQRQLRFLPGSVVVGLVTNTSRSVGIGTSNHGKEGRIVNEGTLIKRGAGTLTFQVKLENRGGVMRFEEGRVAVERQPQGDGQLFLTSGELQFAGGELALYLQSINGATLGLRDTIVSGHGRIINTSPGSGNRVQNGALVRLNSPGQALEIRDMEYRQSAAGELEVTLGAAGCGRLSVLPLGSRSAVLNGRLRVVLEPGFVPEIGQSFLLLEGFRSGTFGEVILPDVGPNRKLEVTYARDQVVIETVAVP